MMKVLMDDKPLEREALAEILAAHQDFLHSGGGGGHWETFCTGSDTETGLVLGIYVATSQATKGTQADLSHKRLDGLGLAGVSLPFANLCGVACTGQDLTGADLTGSLLVDSDFSGSNLRGAHLKGADLSRCDLRGCDLREADLTGANLEHADLSGADLRGAITEGARLGSAVLGQVAGPAPPERKPERKRIERKRAPYRKGAAVPADPGAQLREAAAKGDLAALEQALWSGAPVDGRQEAGDTALNQAAEAGHLEVVRRLVEASADLENRGGAGKTPLMNAALEGKAEVTRFLVEKGARITDDLLSSIDLKVRILEENARDGMVWPEGAAAWKEFLDLLERERLTQDLPALIASLSDADPQVRASALDRVETAGYRGLDLAAALPRLRELTGDPDAEVRRVASAALSTQNIRHGVWDALRGLSEAGDAAVKAGVTSVVVASARARYDILPFLPTLLRLLVDPEPSLRHDAAIALGYAATAGGDVSAAVPDLAARLSDPEFGVRNMAAWALYRIARYVGSIAPAVAGLRALSSDPEDGVREMAAEALRAEEEREAGQQGLG